jgi:hypothetical protein
LNFEQTRKNLYKCLESKPVCQRFRAGFLKREGTSKEIVPNVKDIKYLGFSSKLSTIMPFIYKICSNK